MRTLYNILFTVGFILSSPYYFVRMRRRGNWQKGFAERFGKYDTKLKQAITNRDVLWMHAVSVGEVNLCTQLIRALEPRMPNLKIVVSTTTTTGMGELQRKLPNHISKIYYPIDHRRFVTRALARHPARGHRAGGGGNLAEFPLARARPWHPGVPGQRASCPTGPIAATSGSAFCSGRLFAALAGVGAQNEADAARLRQLGCRPEAIRIVGSLKFDAAQLDERRLLDVPALLRQAGVKPGAPLIVGGSTHAGEEAILAEQFLRLRARFPGPVPGAGAAPLRAQPGGRARAGGARGEVRLSQRTHVPRGICAGRD